MKKNTFRRWGSVVLTAIISTAFLFQNNKMIMRKATIIDLKKTQVVAYTDSPDLEDVGELGEWLLLIIELYGYATAAWNQFCDWYDDGSVFCKCRLINTSNPCMKAHKFNILRNDCHVESVVTFSGNCNTYNSNCPSKQ